jgi:uncharacterized membrane protein
VEALTDGIFAIVMTIMIVGLGELMKFDKSAKEEDYRRLFSGMWGDFVSYAISFMLLGVLWLAHHWQFQYISYIDPPLVFINIIWFMFICLIPFSTMMLGDHPNFFAPVLAFECNILIVFFILYAQWSYATKRKHLVGSSLDTKTISQQRNIVLSLIVITIAVIAISYGYHLLLK